MNRRILFKDEFQQVEQLPVLQLPAAIRNHDSNLKFTPHYKIKKDNFIGKFKRLLWLE